MRYTTIATSTTITCLRAVTMPAAVSSFLQKHLSFLSGSVSVTSSAIGLPFKDIYRPQDKLFELHARGSGRAMARRDSIFSQKDKDDAEAIATIYSMPPLYDLAFGYRNYEEEVDFLIDAHRKYSMCSTTVPLTVIELAAGPARHSLAALSQHRNEVVNSVLALDMSQDMTKYGTENADFELGTGGGRRDDFSYVCGDMRNIEEAMSENEDVQKSRFNAAWLLLGSMQHLLTTDDIIACFKSVNAVLHPGGIVVIELPHPRETFSMGECTKNGWTVPLVDDVDGDGNEKEFGELSIVWGDEDDEFDPVAQVRRFTVNMELSIKDSSDIPQDLDMSPLLQQMTKDGKTKVKEIVPMRLFTLQEIDALARCAGFELVAKYGALSENISIENEDEAFRMVCVLRKAH